MSKRSVLDFSEPVHQRLSGDVLSIPQLATISDDWDDAGLVEETEVCWGHSSDRVP